MNARPKRLKKKLLLLLLILSPLVNLLPAAEEEELVIRRLTSADGLSQDSVTCVIQDKEGFVWFGTADGLNRYDGYGFTIYKHHDYDPNSLSGNFISALFLDDLGQLWVGTYAGLDLYDRGGMRFLHAENCWQLPPESLSEKVMAVQKGSDGTYWLCLRNSIKAVLVKRDSSASGQKGEFIDVPFPSMLKSLNAIALDRFGSIWAGGLGGLVQLRDGRWCALPLKSDSKFMVNSLYADGDDRLWVASNQGLWRLEARASGRGADWTIKSLDGEETGLSSPNVTPVLRDRLGSLWICTRRGLNRLENESPPGAGPRFRNFFHNEANVQSIGHNNIWGICEDRSGIIWVATYGGGAAKIIRKKKAFQCYRTYPEPIPDFKGQSVMALYEDRQGKIWAGTEAGANCLDRRSGQFDFYPGGPEEPANIEVKCFQEDNQGTLWLGTGSGLYWVNRKKRILAPFSFPSAKGSAGKISSYVRCLYRDHQGLIWVGTRASGALTLDTARQAVAPFLSAAGEALAGAYVYCFHEDGGGRMWIGTDSRGLVRVDSPQGESPPSRFYKNEPGNPDSISSNKVLSLCELPTGILWIGTTDGLNRLDVTTGEFQRFSEKEGLPNANIYSVLPDDHGNLWMSTNRGISCFNPARSTFKNYLFEDGLQNNEFNGGAYCRCRDGLLAFGGINGFNTILPGDRKEAPAIPPVYATGFRLLRRTATSASDIDLFKEISSKGSLQLSYRENSFSIDFSVLDYRDPAKNEYSYMLEGLDPGWIYAGNRHYASYSSLPAGRFTFHVRGADSQGAWNEKGFAFAVTIFPPFWRTWWFYLTGGLLVVLSASFAYALRVGQLKKREKQLSLLVEKRTSELANANKELERLSLTDPLTQLPNRRNFELIIAQEWKRCSRESQPLSLLMIDIDFFKLYNDTYGHPQGDSCLRQVAASIQRCTSRAGDFVARLGGEEFSVILPNTDSPGAQLMAERVRESIEELALPHASSSVSPHITISVGVAMVIPVHDQDFDTLIATSDQALYRAKTSGRNRIAAAGA